MRPAYVPKPWADAGLAVLRELEARGHPLALTALSLLGRERADETFLSGAWLKTRLLEAGVHERVAAARCREHGAVVFAAGLDPWAVAAELEAAHAARGDA